jgi:hypothetical protein
VISSESSPQKRTPNPTALKQQKPASHEHFQVYLIRNTQKRMEGQSNARFPPPDPLKGAQVKRARERFLVIVLGDILTLYRSIDSKFNDIQTYELTFRFHNYVG